MPLPVLPSQPDHAVGTLIVVISELNGWPALPLSTLRRILAEYRRMTRGHNGAASPFMWGSFIPYSMPVYPGAFSLTLLIHLSLFQTFS
jgi:hypothetical protein